MSLQDLQREIQLFNEYFQPLSRLGISNTLNKVINKDTLRLSPYRYNNIKSNMQTLGKTLNKISTTIYTNQYPLMYGKSPEFTKSKISIINSYPLMTGASQSTSTIINQEPKDGIVNVKYSSMLPKIISSNPKIAIDILHNGFKLFNDLSHNLSKKEEISKSIENVNTKIISIDENNNLSQIDKEEQIKTEEKKKDELKEQMVDNDKDIIISSEKLEKTIDIIKQKLDTPRHYYILLAVIIVILVLCIYFIFYKI